MEILIKTISNDKMRIPGGVGDYWYDESGVLQIRVVEMNDDFLETCVAVHEIVEEAITKRRGLTEPEIQAFDEYYEQRRKMGLVPEDGEAGFDNNAPYLREHTLSTGIEMMMCALAGVSWNDYSEKVNSL